MPGIELGLSGDRFALAALSHDALGLVQRLGECLPHGLPHGTGLALDLALQAPHDGALAFDGPAHALELAGMGVAPGLAAELLAFLGKGLLEIDSDLLGGLDQLHTCRLQQAAVGGVGNCLVLHRAVHDDAGKFLGFDQLEVHGHADGLCQQFFHAFLAQELAKLDQGGGVAGLAVFKVPLAREELPGRRLTPARNHAFVGFVEGVLEVQQGDHHPQWHAGAPGIGCAGHGR